MCVRHIYANIKSNLGNIKRPYMKPLIWNLAWSYSVPEYEANLARILEYDESVYNEVMKQQPQTWSRAFQRLGTYVEDVENNSVESFNASIVKARGKHFVPMLETIRRLALVRIAKRSALSCDHKGICTPYVADFLATEHEIAAECTVHRSTNGQYEVIRSGCSYRVNLDRRTCSCRKFDLCGIPCGHTYAAIINKRLESEEFVCHWFRTFTWRRTYENGLIPLRGPAFWPSTDGPNIFPPPPRSMPGRKKGSAPEKRKKSAHESPSKKKPTKKKRTMHCSICGKPNHNSRFHKKTQSQEDTITGDGSQGQLTQLTLQDED